MKILLVSLAFPPAPIVGSFRAGNVVRALVEAGHEVLVITAAVERGSRPVFSGPGELRVHSVTPMPGPKQAYRWLKSRAGTKAREGPAASLQNESAAPPRGGPRWKRYLLSLLGVPDDDKGFIVPALRAAWRAGAGEFDLVYTSAPPHSTHLVGLILKRFTKVRWVMEYRDPWNGNPSRADEPASGLSRWLNMRLERLCLRDVDEVVTVTEGIRDIVLRQSSVLLPVHVVRNGIDRIGAPGGEASTGGPLRILYVGTLYMDRDPRPFIRALGLLRRRGLLPAGTFDVHFVGRCRSFGGISVAAFAAEHGVADLIRFTDWVDHQAARELIDQADILLLLAQSQPAQVPNKLYEYLGSRRAILALADEDGETSFLLRKLPGHYLVTRFEPEAIASELQRALHEPRGRDGASGEDVLKSLSTQAQMAKLVRELGLERGDARVSPQVVTNSSPVRGNALQGMTPRQKES